MKYVIEVFHNIMILKYNGLDFCYIHETGKAIVPINGHRNASYFNKRFEL